MPTVEPDDRLDDFVRALAEVARMNDEGLLPIDDDSPETEVREDPPCKTCKRRDGTHPVWCPFGDGSSPRRAELTGRGYRQSTLEQAACATGPKR